LIICTCFILPFVVIIIFFGPQLFSILLGQEWHAAGQLAQIYVPFMIVHLMVSTLTPTAQVVGKLGTALGLGTVQCTLMVLGIWLGARFGNEIADSVKGLVIMTTPFMILTLVFFWLMSRNSTRA
jgi:O-antigen/teichoic acid export membrane protein